MGEFEELILLIVCLLAKRAYSIAVLHALEQQTGRTASISTVHATLYRLERKGLLLSRLGDPTEERGNRPKRFYEVTGAGVEALRETRRLRTRLWQLIPDFSLGSTPR